MADEKVDYLDVDTPINGQNYCCISFLLILNALLQTLPLHWKLTPRNPT